jgi:hypothetical protein
MSRKGAILMTDGVEPVRALFCFGLLPAFYELDGAGQQAVAETLMTAYADLERRFGITVLATLDDDRTAVGPALGWPWTCYILADAPNHDAVAKFCNIIREFQVGENRLWRYMKVEARSGRELFFGRT